MNVDLAQTAKAKDIHLQRTTDPVAVEHADQIVDAMDGDAVQPDHDIAGQNPGARGRAVRLDLRQERAHLVLDAGDHRMPTRYWNGLAGHADIGAADIAMADA